MQELKSIIKKKSGEGYDIEINVVVEKLDEDGNSEECECNNVYFDTDWQKALQYTLENKERLLSTYKQKEYFVSLKATFYKDLEDGSLSEKHFRVI